MPPTTAARRQKNSRKKKTYRYHHQQLLRPDHNQSLCYNNQIMPNRSRYIGARPQTFHLGPPPSVLWAVVVRLLTKYATGFQDACSYDYVIAHLWDFLRKIWIFGFQLRADMGRKIALVGVVNPSNFLGA